MEGRSSHDGAQRRGTDNKAPGAGKKPDRRGNRGQRSSNGPETTGEPSYPLAQGGNQEETSPTEATEKEATEVSAFTPILRRLRVLSFSFLFFFFVFLSINSCQLLFLSAESARWLDVVDTACSTHVEIEIEEAIL